MDNNEKTERDKYIEGLQQKISKAVTAKRFNESDEGKMIREYASERINAVIKEIGGIKFLNDPQGYAQALGELHAYQRLLVMLDSEAGKDTGELTVKLREAKNDG